MQHGTEMTRTCFQLLSCSSFTGRNMNGGGSALLLAGSSGTMRMAPWYFQTQLAHTMLPSLLFSYHATESATTYTAFLRLPLCNRCNEHSRNCNRLHAIRQYLTQISQDDLLRNVHHDTWPSLSMNFARDRITVVRPKCLYG